MNNEWVKLSYSILGSHFSTLSCRNQQRKQAHFAHVRVRRVSDNFARSIRICEPPGGRGGPGIDSPAASTPRDRQFVARSRTYARNLQILSPSHRPPAVLIKRGSSRKIRDDGGSAWSSRATGSRSAACSSYRKYQYARNDSAGDTGSWLTRERRGVRSSLLTHERRRVVSRGSNSIAHAFTRFPVPHPFATLPSNSPIVVRCNPLPARHANAPL